MIQAISFLWNQILITPSTNLIVVLDRLFFGSYGLAIIVFTLLLRGLTLPLTLRQIQSSKKMQTLQPRLQEIQKKYSDPKRRSEETMKLYKTEGVNPAGCLLPTLIQFPIWIALYSVIKITLATTPESLIDLSHRLYPWSFVQQAVPLASHFLWLNLGAADKTYVLPILVFATMWLQQKLTMTQQTMAANSQTAQTNQMMLWFMPLIFAWFSVSVPSGLAVYWVITNIAGIALNYYVFEWHGKPVSEMLGLGSFSLGSLKGVLLGSAQPKNKRRVDSRQQRRPQLSERQPRDEYNEDDSGASADGAASVPRNGAPRTSAPRGGPNGRSGQARRRGAAPAKAQPKAPPVTRPAPAPRSSGRLDGDPAASNGGGETRSTDGRDA
ncbi:MAG TPA: YidC/Oxa1 family membrane protein insertase [Dehalococcoidia bacterium]